MIDETRVAPDHVIPFELPTATQLRARRSLKWATAEAVWGPEAIGAWVAEMDFGLAPPVAAALRGSADDAQVGYLPAWLDREHGEACADWQATQFGWQVDPRGIHAVGDVLQVLSITIDQFTTPGSPVILPTPAYMPFFALPPARGRDIIEVPSPRRDGRYELDLDGIAAAFEAGAELLILCNPHNPTGQVASRAELEAVCEVVAAHGGRVFADEIHASLTYPGSPPHIPYASISPVAASHTITGTSTSKSFNLPGLRCAAAIVSNPADAGVWDGLHLVVTHGAATPGVAASIAAYRDGWSWFVAVRDYLAGNRELLTDLVAERLPGVRMRAPEATYLAWLDFTGVSLPGRSGYDDGPGRGGTAGDGEVSVAAWIAEHTRVMVTEGAEFGEPGRGFIRLNIGTPRPILREIIERISAALDRR